MKKIPEIVFLGDKEDELITNLRKEFYELINKKDITYGFNGPKRFYNDLNHELVPKHIVKIIEHFKNRDNIRIVMGAGDDIGDRKRFSKFDILITIARTVNSVKCLFDDLSNENFNPPYTLLIDFNSKLFFLFLDRLKGRISEIIFDVSVLKFIAWKMKEFKLVNNALKKNGVLILDNEIDNIPVVFVSFGSTSNRWILAKTKGNDYDEYVARAERIEKGKQLEIDFNDYDVSFIPVILETGITYSIFPSKDKVTLHRKKFLEKAGFDPIFLETKKVKYPLSNIKSEIESYFIAIKK